MLVTDSDIIQKIRNTTCIVCGQRFSSPRAGKLYCSAKCKQFSFYHKDQINTIQSALKGLHESSITLSLKEYESYKRLTDNRLSYRNLQSRENKSYFTENDEKRLGQLEKALSLREKTEKPKYLTLEEWSFFKTLYPNTPFDQFIKIIDTLSRLIIERIRGEEQIPKIKNDLLRNQFEHHLKNILQGKIKFK